MSTMATAETQPNAALPEKWVCLTFDLCFVKSRYCIVFSRRSCVESVAASVRKSLTITVTPAPRLCIWRTVERRSVSMPENVRACSHPSTFGSAFFPPAVTSLFTAPISLADAFLFSGYFFLVTLPVAVVLDDGYPLSFLFH